MTSNINNDLLDSFYWWIEERHKIYLRRLAGEPKPWTQDTIMQDYKFCNVFRELDTTTIWIKENIRDRWADHPYLWFALCLARRINLIDTMVDLDDLLVNWDAEKAHSILNNRKDSDKRIYNGAYMITTGGRKVPKNEDTCWNILEPLWAKREEITNTLKYINSIESAFYIFANGHVGYSNFLAYEIVTDMRHTKYLREATDIYTWANAGPGAVRGLNRLHNRPLNSKIKSCQTNAEMQQLLIDSDLYLDNGFPVLEMRDIEHSLCEFDKYQRVGTDKSFLRQKYNGRG